MGGLSGVSAAGLSEIESGDEISDESSGLEASVMGSGGENDEMG